MELKVLAEAMSEEQVVIAIEIVSYAEDQLKITRENELINQNLDLLS